MKSKYSVKNLALIGVMAAFVFAASWISINIPTAVDNTRLHLGNVLCILSGILLGGIPGGLAAGIGSMFFDLTNPLYSMYAPITLVTKFAMGFIAGKVAWIGGKNGTSIKQNTIAAILASAGYIVLYLTQHYITNYFFLRAEIQTVMITLAQKAVISSINSTFTVLIVVPLVAAIQKALGGRNISK